MDHIPLPKDHHPHLKVPYLCQDYHELTYDYRSFEEFPQRKGFTSISLRGDGMATAENAARFQSWNFFALVIDYFHTMGIDTNIQDFLASEENGRTYVTTCCLPGLSRKMEALTRDMHLEQRAAIYSQVKYKLVTSSITVRQLAGFGDPHSSWPLIHLSVLLLGEHLQSICDFFLQCRDDTPSPWWGRSPLSQQLMDDAPWCPHLSATMLDQEMEQSCIYFLSRMTKEASDTHAQCRPDMCTLDTLDNEKYITQHIGECPDSGESDHVLLDPPEWALLLDIVAERQVERSKNRCTTSNSAHSENSSAVKRYVCISHVWSDGMGNPHQNSLPACQILRLQRLVNDLYSTDEHPVPFWVDTICVPLQSPYRKLAISSMATVYKDAEKVLVIDSAISSAPSSRLHSIEMAFRLRTSSWVRRLWTFQEAYLAKELHYQFQDTAYTLSRIRQKYHQEQQALAQLSEESERTCGSDGGEGTTLQPTSYTAPNAPAWKRIEGGDLLWHNAYRFLEQVEVLGKNKPQGESDRLRSILHPLRWRTTSKLEDETICLSGCMDLSLDRLPWSSGAQERMKMFLSSMRTVPVGLMFVDRPRIESEGCRWMPTSFLAGGMDSTLPDSWNPEGSASVGRPTTSGLLVTLPGIMLSNVTKYAQAFRYGHVHDIIFISVDGVPYHVYGLLSKPVQWDIPEASGQLALVLREPLPQRSTFACFVTILAEHSGIKYVRFQSCVMVMGNPGIHRNLDEVTFTTAITISTSQKWCVG
ncbi:MAG: hypothetical protein Q9212_003842 [Teloschistes hypoglaucus]